MTKTQRTKAKALIKEMDQYEALKNITEHGEPVLFRSSIKNQVKFYDHELNKHILEFVVARLNALDAQLEKL